MFRRKQIELIREQKVNRVLDKIELLNSNSNGYVFLEIISGGQAGADLGGIDFALKHQIKCKINTHKNFISKNNETIPQEVPIFIVSQSTSYKGLKERTLFNVQTSDLTLIIHEEPLKQTKGSLLTRKLCKSNNAPFLTININDSPDTIDLSTYFNSCPKHFTLNVAGQRTLKRADVVTLLDGIFNITPTYL